MILNGRYAEAKEAALWYQKTFGDFYLEIMRHPIPELEAVNKYLVQMGSGAQYSYRRHQRYALRQPRRRLRPRPAAVHRHEHHDSRRKTHENGRRLFLSQEPAGDGGALQGYPAGAGKYRTHRRDVQPGAGVRAAAPAGNRAAAGQNRRTSIWPTSAIKASGSIIPTPPRK